MRPNIADVILLAISSVYSIVDHSLTHGARTQDTIENTEDFCWTESLHLQCTISKAILMNSAIYGRMRVGRCIKAEEVAKFGNEPPYFGCSANVLSILDDKCSGKSECDIRHSDISNELTEEPCFPGLKVYLEASYDCIAIADEDRSCTLTVSNVPSHIIASSESRRKCGTKTQPWMIEAPPGQKIKVTLIDFLSPQMSQNEKSKKKSCVGVIVDIAAKRNVSICVEGEQRTRYLYSSKAETAEIVYNTQENDENRNGINQFALKLEAVGCSDLIAPEDAWLKRNDDSIVIGCYSNRLSWELHCDGERWIGVFGNCSQRNEFQDLLKNESEIKKIDWTNEQILTAVAVGGFTLLVCLTVLCIAIVFLRRFSTKKMKSQEYKVIDFQIDSSINKTGIDGITNGTSSATHQQTAPTYSVFVGEDEFNATATNNRQ